MSKSRVPYLMLGCGLFTAVAALMPACRPGGQPEGPGTEKQESRNPNIVIILADDMGYGDVGAYNSGSRIPTPNLDRMASRGMMFTDAHSNSAVCTPTRYGLLTGRYCFRTPFKSGVLGGFSPSLIEPGRMTLGTFLQQQGYHTACIGKWHLGVDWKKKDKDRPLWEGPWYMPTGSENVDYTAPVHGGPADHGFDYSYICPAALSFPYCYIRNRHVVNPEMEYTGPVNRGRGVHWRRGHASVDFVLKEVMPELTRKAVDYIVRRNRQAPDSAFFLYFAMTAPHMPWLPTEDFRGSSEAGLYGDFCVQVDHSAGRILNTLDSLDIGGNTLVVFTSDNGARWNRDDISKYGHRANYIYRGMKSMLWEGGHRVPFIVRWPERVEAGSRSERMVNMTDFLVTLAGLFDRQLPWNSGEDSYSFLSALTGEASALPPRDHLINRSFKGKTAIRKGDWKLIMHNGHGGIFVPDPPITREKWQLYNLKDDPRETRDLYGEFPARADSLHDLFRMYDEEGRSRRPSTKDHGF